jgi:hypothetical protein
VCVRVVSVCVILCNSKKTPGGLVLAPFFIERVWFFV